MFTGLLTLLTLLFTPADATPVDGTLLVQDGDLITLAVPAEHTLMPGAWIAVYATELRPHPLTGETLEGLRYAGDGRVVWLSDGLATVMLEHADQALAAELRVRLDQRRDADPTRTLVAVAAVPQPARVPGPMPPSVPVLVPTAAASLPASVAEAAEAAEEPSSITGRSSAQRDAPRESRGLGWDTVNAGYGVVHGGRRHGLATRVDWADDGADSGVGAGSVAWFWLPEKGVGRVAVRLEGLRGSRWVAGSAGSDEPAAREPAVGYWLWTRIEGPAVPLSYDLGVAVGVQATGPAPAVRLGLRSGQPWAGHLRGVWESYGALGNRLTLAGAVPLRERVRLGLRVRNGSLPLHDPPGGAKNDWAQQRADGTLRVTWDISDSLTWTVGGGVAGYDLLLADAGPVFDGGLELRW